MKEEGKYTTTKIGKESYNKPPQTSKDHLVLFWNERFPSFQTCRCVVCLSTESLPSSSAAKEALNVFWCWPFLLISLTSTGQGWSAESPTQNS